MRYTIEDENTDSVSLEKITDGVILSTDNGGQFTFTLDEFKEFRKAVGYVWQEVHSDGE